MLVFSIYLVDGRSTISLDIKLPIGYSLVALIGDILNQDAFSDKL